MTYFPRFAEPWVLLFLVAVPWSIYLGARIRSLGALRKWTAVTLRTLILLCLIAALAGTEIVKRNDRLAVFFLLDHSNSVPEDMRLASAQQVRNMTEANMTSRDEAGVIVFGEEASIEQGVAPKLTGEDGGIGLREIRSYVGGEQSDLAGALRLAMAAFPQGYMRRVVLFSDGNETRGAAVEEAKLAQAEGIEIDVLPLRPEGRKEVRIREVSAPSQANADEPFQLRIVVESTNAATGEMQVYQRAGESRRMLLPQQVQLQPGDNVFLLTQELGRSGFYEYEARIETSDDTIAANNVGKAFTTVYGEPVVLYVEAHPENSTYLEPALTSEGIHVRQIQPAQFPSSLAQLQSFDGVILSDVSATDLSSQQLGLLKAMVRDQGIGLVMIGGPDTFGAGGYLDTPVEEALPVDMDIKQRRILPRGALVAILHTCEFRDGNAWARKIALAALNALSSQDLMGGIGYTNGDSWLFQIQSVGDKKQLAQTITSESALIGDMPSTGPSLQMAYTGLQKVDAAVKRIIMISDGDPGAPPPALLQSLKAAKIAVSTICINPHSMNDQNMLQSVAQATGGQYYFVTNPNNLPQIFTKEASVVKRGLLIEKPFVPALHHDSELLLGMTGSGLPQLRGYVVTSPKENATVPLVSHEGDPVLVHWRFGLGKSLAFTSDVTNRWAADWLGWDGFQRFWAQSVRWTLRELTPSNFRVETRQRGGRGHVRIDAVDEQGNFINFLHPKGIVTLPDFSSKELELVQTAPGIYEGGFPASEQGVYMMNLSYDNPDGTRGMVPAGLAVGYSKEYEYHTANIPLLEQIATAGGGDFIAPDANPFEHTLEASAAVTPIWPYLAALAACLLPFEIFVRRVMVPWSLMGAGLRRGARVLPGLKRLIAPPKEREAPVTGVYRAAAATRDFGEPEEARDFGEVRAPATESAPAEVRTPPVPERIPEKPGTTAYTQQLLAAKERALKSKQRTKDGDKPGGKENTP